MEGTLHSNFIEENGQFFLPSKQVREQGYVFLTSVIQFEVSIMKNHIVRTAEDNSTALVKALFPELLKDQIQK